MNKHLQRLEDRARTLQRRKARDFKMATMTTTFYRRNEAI